jgi:hypothetical protein
MKGVFQYNSKRNIYHRTCKIFLKFDDLRLPTFNFLLIDSIFKRNYSVILGHYLKLWANQLKGLIILFSQVINFKINKQ